MGDRVLREVADILRRAVRIFDVCARYGGEEFVILMPGADAPTAFRIAERIRRQVEQHFVSGPRAGSPAAPTVSVGVSSAHPTTTRETLIAQADSALFQAKGTRQERRVRVSLTGASGIAYNVLHLQRSTRPAPTCTNPST